MGKSVLTCVAVLFMAVADAAVTMPHVFGDNMVLQQGQKVPVWGKADPGEKVTVSFAGQTVSATADAAGRWKLFLAPLTASDEGRDLTVSSKTLNSQLSTLNFRGAVVGEVWFCSGQSNMEFPMGGLPWDATRRIKDSEREIAAAKHPLLRHFKSPRKVSNVPQDDVDAKWELTTPETVANKSAVAYVFGETLLKELKVPVGLIDCSWGGTRIEPWTPAGHPDDLYLLQNIKSWQRRHDVPTVLWNGMVAGICPYAIKGAIWYQGCANRADGADYIDKTVSLVRGWRREWGQGDFPYFLVQLAPFKYDNVRGSVLPVFQEAQARIPEKVPNSGYTVINDVGNVNDIHPTDKRTVGMRMADQALDRVYGRFVRPWKTPVLKSCKTEGRELRVTFENAAGLKTRDGLPPTEFEVSGLLGTWVPATARIEGCDVILSAEGVESPLRMRFAPYNGSTPNLVNGDGLPAGPFHFGCKVPLGAAEGLPELKGFTCVQRYDIPVCCDLRRTPPKTLASVADVKRVAYLLELEDPAGDVTFAFAEMDAFAASSDDLVLTAKPGSRLYRQPVKNLTVRSNVASVRPCTGVADGFLEFYTCNYSPKKRETPSGGEEAKYDFNDTPQPQNTLGYGCLQVHDLKAKSAVLAFNHINSDKVPCDVGIGFNRTTDHPDWTFARNAGKFKARRLSVWVKGE